MYTHNTRGWDYADIFSPAVAIGTAALDDEPVFELVRAHRGLLGEDQDRPERRRGEGGNKQEYGWVFVEWWHPAPTRLCPTCSVDEP
jgi:hypothetical protein